MERESIEEILKGEFFGHTHYHDTIKNFDLYEVETADPVESWECADWYLVNGDNENERYHIAHCDGYTGTEKTIEDEKLRVLLGFSATEWEEGEQYDFWDKIDSFELTGKLIAEAKAEQLEDMEEKEGACAIWVTPNYYENQLNAPVAHFALAENEEKLIFSKFQDAQAWIDEKESGRYYLSNGEAGRPDYRIVKCEIGKVIETSLASFSEEEVGLDI